MQIAVEFAEHIGEVFCGLTLADDWFRAERAVKVRLKTPHQSTVTFMNSPAVFARR